MKETSVRIQSWIRRGMLVLLIASAAGLWWTEGREASTQPLPPTPVPTTSKSERTKREEGYEQDVASLQKMLETGAADEATQELAARKLTELISEHQNELGLEAALQEAGYANAVVIVQNGAVTVMIPQESLNEDTSAQILALCVAHTDAGAENVRVMALR